MNAESNFDVIIIGGSYAGLSAAMALGRSLRKVLVIDSGLPCNRQTPHSHNFLTQDGSIPAEIAGLSRHQVMQYKTVQFLDGIATKGQGSENGFVIETQKGQRYRSEKLLFATGIKDLMPDIKGISDCWGISVVHCPYCHGYEFRGERTGIIANGDRSVHLALLVRNLTKNDIILFSNGKPDLNGEQTDRLISAGVQIEERLVAEILHEKGAMTGLVLADGNQINLNVAYAAIPFIQHSAIPEALGCELAITGHLKIDDMQMTTVPGVFACGDNSSPVRSVAGAIATGNKVGAMINMQLVNEKF